MGNLVELIDSCDIKERRSMYKSDLKRLKYTKKRMERLEDSKLIKRYKRKVERLNYLNNNFDRNHYRELVRLRRSVDNLEHFSQVEYYKRLYNDVLQLEEYIKKYYITINILLRKELLDHNIPNIYVFQGILDIDSNLKLYRNIVSPNTVKTELDDNDIGLYPKKDIQSRRKYRSFYNRVSFKYLESLSKDCSFDVEGKKLKNVKVLKRDDKKSF